MQFIDPFVLLQLNVSDPHAVDSSMLLSAEAHLSQLLSDPDGHLSVNGGAIPVANAQVLIAEMRNPLSRQLFWKMRGIEGLIPFLEGGNIPKPGLIVSRCKDVGDVFFEFVSRWLAHEINERLGASLQSGRWMEAQQMGRLGAAVHSNHEAAASEAGQIFFGELAKVIDRLARGQVQHLREHHIRNFHQSSILGALNTLPPCQQPIRDEVALALSLLISNIAASQPGAIWTYAVAEDACRIRATPELAAKVSVLATQVKSDSGIEEHQARESTMAARAGMATVISIVLGILGKILVNILF